MIGTLRKVTRVSAITALSIALPLLALPQQESLGDLARQQREQRQKEGKKATRVYTNDNLPTHPPEDRTPKEPAIPVSASEDKTNPSPPSTAEKKGSERPSPESNTQTKDDWQARFVEARRNLSHAKEQQQLAEDELNLLQIQEVREIDPATKQGLTAKVQAKQSDVEVVTATTAAAQKDLDDLEREFKDAGAPDDWKPAP
jgi:hypothetical protein